MAKFCVPALGESSPSPQKEASYTPTLLFFPHDEHKAYTGYEAISQYLGNGMEGRLIQSIKTFLPSTSFESTVIQGKLWNIEDLIALFLDRLLEQSKQSLGPLSPPYIFGRPAIFSPNPEHDKLAEARLQEGAARAGIKELTFVIEPVAAALAYESQLEQDETILVGDLGGGTTDFCVMRVGPTQKQRKRSQSILASGGLSIAGDRFDAAIVKTKLFPHLGYLSQYKTPLGTADVPSWLYHKLLQWNQIAFLKGKKTRNFFNEVERHSLAPEAIKALLQIVDEDLGFVMYRAVEAAKRAAAFGHPGTIEAIEYEFPLQETLTPLEFETTAQPLIVEISHKLDEVLENAEVKFSEVDAVFLTGGTSHIPSIRRIFSDRFGPEKIRARNNFTSVVDGLARGGSEMRLS